MKRLPLLSKMIIFILSFPDNGESLKVYRPNQIGSMKREMEILQCPVAKIKIFSILFNENYLGTKYEQ